MPIIFRSIADKEAKIEKTAIMIIAALVTTPAPLAITPTTASGVLAPASRRSGEV
jgi:hypothetical protein